MKPNIKPPEATFQLSNGDMFLFRVDHASLHELHEHTACIDPLDHVFDSLKKFGTSEFWDYSWALTYKHRKKNYPNLSFLDFLELLPVKEDWIELRSLLMTLLVQALPSPKKKSELKQDIQLPENSVGESDMLQQS